MVGFVRLAPPALPHISQDGFGVNDTPPPDWAAIRRAYEHGGDTVEAIARDHGLSLSSIYWRAKQDKWARRRKGGQRRRRADLIGRLYELFERQMSQIETDMTGQGDKEAQLLGHLARTLEKLIELETDKTVQKTNDQPARDMANLRSELAARIERLGATGADE